MKHSDHSTTNYPLKWALFGGYKRKQVRELLNTLSAELTEVKDRASVLGEEKENLSERLKSVLRDKEILEVALDNAEKHNEKERAIIENERAEIIAKANSMASAIKSKAEEDARIKLEAVEASCKAKLAEAHAKLELFQKNSDLLDRQADALLQKFVHQLEETLNSFNELQKIKTTHFKSRPLNRILEYQDGINESLIQNTQNDLGRGEGVAPRKEVKPGSPARLRQKKSNEKSGANQMGIMLDGIMTGR